MREILFRGKSENDGRWIYGDYSPGQGKYPPNIFPQDEGGSYREGINIIPETVGQYTGLNDKNGKKIFEGDIVDYEDESPGQYEYHDSTFINRGVIEYDAPVFYWTNLVAAQFYDNVYKGVADCVVIGNIHDNPELLEVE